MSNLPSFIFPFLLVFCPDCLPFIYQKKVPFNFIKINNNKYLHNNNIRDEKEKIKVFFFNFRLERLNFNIYKKS